jgi:NAD(P) transhydrogenase subunit alpha
VPEPRVPAATQPPAPLPAKGGHGAHGGSSAGPGSLWLVLGALTALLLAGSFAPREFVAHLTVFVLACFIGWQVIWNVTPALHTPLMSVTNAISGIIVVGGMLQLSHGIESPVTLLGALAVLVATINIAGGFLVTQRMLRMFRR